MLTLGIETSCDETAIAIVENGHKILANLVASSLPLHQQYGGVVPEIATRHHVEVINFVLKKALKKAGVDLKEIDLIAVTYGPGLVGSLLIGISLAKALSLALEVPLVAVNHLRAHLYAVCLEREENIFPFIGLIVSGGHSNLVSCRDIFNWRSLGQTQDDAAGEAYDKVARILNLGYPGGPLIDRLAKKGNPGAIFFPRADLGERLDFSFSGLKTAVLYFVKKQGKEIPIKDIAASFQEAVVDALVNNAWRACQKYRVNKLVIGGGVSANSRLREKLRNIALEKGIRIFLPQLDLCLDNAAMVAGLGYQLYQRDGETKKNLSAEPNLSIERL